MIVLGRTFTKEETQIK